KLEDENIIAAMNTLQAKIDTIEFNLAYLRDEEEKYRILYENNAISKTAYNKVNHETGMVEMQLKELYAQRDEITVRLKDTLVTAPMSGVVREVNYNPGDLAVMGKPLAIIDDISKLIIKVNISESDLKEVRVGTPVLLEIEGVEDKVVAKVTKVLPSINSKTRIGEVEIEIKKLDKGHSVILGTSIKTEFIKKAVEDAFTVPQSALKQLASGYVLYRIDDEYVHEVPVETGIKTNNQVQIVKGLTEGDKVAASNIDKLYDGAKVYVFEGKEQ
ncbi:MAG: efflux RND transporter periplasmic adaptor subunit, partial [Clostridiaceae bacterium]|nr:efflux RND transporter periplasmic adaptor subunit [Clostridiaceae bacterium]